MGYFITPLICAMQMMERPLASGGESLTTDKKPLICTYNRTIMAGSVDSLVNVNDNHRILIMGDSILNVNGKHCNLDSQFLEMIIVWHLCGMNDMCHFTHASMLSISCCMQAQTLSFDEDRNVQFQ